jgi:hypothetical protein
MARDRERRFATAEQALSSWREVRARMGAAQRLPGRIGGGRREDPRSVTDVTLDGSQDCGN